MIINMGNLRVYRVGIFLFFMFFLLCLWVVSYKTTGHEKSFRFDIVVAHYNEDLMWMCNPLISKAIQHAPMETTIYIYNKGPDIPSKDMEKLRQCFPSTVFVVIQLPNVGRETHTYFYHIISRYHNLADMTCFLPGSGDTSFKIEKVISTIELAVITKETVFLGERLMLPDPFVNFQIEQHPGTNDKNRTLNHDTNLKLAHKRPYGNWFHDIFPKYERIMSGYNFNAIFAVHKKHIQQHPLEYYNDLIQYVETDANPEAGHYFERSWMAVFYPFPQELIYTNS